MKKYLNLMSTKTKMKCAGVMLLAVLSAIFASVWPVKLGAIYNEVSAGKISNLTQGMMMIVTFALMYLMAECISILRRVALDCIVASHEAEIRESSIEKLLKMPVAYHNGSKSGEKTAQLNQGVAGMSQLIKITCNDIITTVLTAICTIIQVVLNAPGIMVLVMVSYMLLTIVISVFQIRSQNGIRESIINKKNSLDGQVCESISNLELIRSMDAQEYEKERLKPGINQIKVVEKKHHKFMGTFDSIKQICKILFQVGLIVASIILISKGKMTPGTIITVCLLFQQLIKPIDDVYRFIDETASSVVKAKILTEIMSSDNDPVYGIKSTGAMVKDEDIILKDVIIMNPEKTKALASYDEIRIPCRKKIALKGPSGCGKTSMIRAINRFYPYVSGTISLLGNDIDNFSQKELTEYVFYVPQQAFFFAGSIKDNLVYGLNRNVTETEMISALRKACLLDILVNKVNEASSHSNGKQDILSYYIGEGGTMLSGGERQRLAIARAFLRTPKIYIFDESTANLDTNTSEKVLNNVEEHAKDNNAGVIYISHDDNVVSRCDMVIDVINKVNTNPEGLAA